MIEKYFVRHYNKSKKDWGEWVEVERQVFDAEQLKALQNKEVKSGQGVYDTTAGEPKIIAHSFITPAAEGKIEYLYATKPEEE